LQSLQILLLSSDEDTKAVTIRLTDSEIQLYDTVAKSMGLTRQDFLSHLIRSNFRQSLKEFVIGYTDSNPSIPLSVLFNSHTENEDVRLKLSIFSYISQELMQEDEQASYDEMENHISSPLALVVKVFLLRKEIQND
jgi:hypothetical protein